MTPLFRGTCTALVTPFTSQDELDFVSLERLIDFQIAGGIDAILLLGTTGENPTLSFTERRRLLETAIAHVAGRVPVIVDTGNNDTRTSITLARQAAAAGADGQLVVGPYYNKPTQQGFMAHVEAIADAAPLPIILYNVPGRTQFNIAAETTLALAERLPSVVGIKEASGNLAQISDILLRRPSTLSVYAGDDEMTLPIAALGGDGVVSVISNALPDQFGRFVQVALAGRFEEARSLHFGLLAAMRACFAETNPIPIKAALAEMGLIGPHVRLPLTPISDAARERVHRAFRPLVARAA